MLQLHPLFNCGRKPLLQVRPAKPERRKDVSGFRLYLFLQRLERKTAVVLLKTLHSLIHCHCQYDINNHAWSVCWQYCRFNWPWSISLYLLRNFVMLVETQSTFRTTNKSEKMSCNMRCLALKIVVQY